MYIKLHLRTTKRVEFIDITERVEKVIKDNKIESGICYIFCPHTTAGLTINENADPSVVEDIISVLDKIAPQSLPYRHSEGNSPAHVKAMLVGNHVAVFVEKNSLVLGTWQGIYFCEFDGPRERSVWIFVVATR
jgi:secondary thiamine-phosphate synthase enzyme